MKTKVKILQTFVHGRDRFDPSNADQEFTKGDAQDLAKAGLVEIVGDAQPQEKQAAEVENKMVEAPANKELTTAKRK